ncbi:LPXTG cell wall anchor domain-containing protein [Bombilactobacillus folatiphilus]|uniref:LPXTG cell wall anchor domain-containing protein n=1 Tax=Bombilactobacillus folatiphilus TaxID=2923362 RepID=A0ABY4P8K0_9LACO|nr:LPXTG cell wall anchor domain-containing protein [Bombilactobacillus folatiphilus]UQS81861.1 LPXTG cell wall anchor domain-containing protein [Bombilactobacillus folatiphilus]
MNKTTKSSKRLTWRKVTGLLVAVVATIVVVIGAYSTAMWAGTDYDYQGNEVAQALPVTQGYSRGGEDTNSNTKSSTASVIVKGTNVASEQGAKLDKLDYPQTGGNNPGAVQVVGSPNYPQTGNATNYGAIALGSSLLLGLSLCYCKKSKSTLQ